MYNDNRFPLKVVPLSHNSKTGYMAATYRPVGDTCPQDCFFLDNGCYAQRHMVGIHMRKSRNDYHELDRMLASGVKYIRHHVSGDAFRGDELDTEYLDFLIAWHAAHLRVFGYMYTHRIEDFVAAGYTHDAFPKNLRIIASADKPGTVEVAKANGFQYSRVEQTQDDALNNRGKDEVVCPNQLAKRNGKTLTCTQCRLCIDRDEKPGIVFMKH